MTKVKKLMMLLVVAALAFANSAFANVFGVLGNAGKALVGVVKPTVESPLLQQLGVSVRGVNVDILNNTPLVGVMYVYGKKTATIEPGDVAHGKIHFEPLNSQVPIVVLFYEDTTLTRYRGAAAQTFTVSAAYPMSVHWTIQAGEIRSPDGSYVQAEIYPRPRVKLERKNAFHRNWWGTREWWNASVGVQILNNTFFRAAILVNGEKRVELEPGELAFLDVRNYGLTSGYTETIQLVFMDSGLLAGCWETTLYVPTEGVFMYQNIISPYDIRR